MKETDAAQPHHKVLDTSRRELKVRVVLRLLSSKRPLDFDAAFYAPRLNVAQLAGTTRKDQMARGKLCCSVKRSWAGWRASLKSFLRRGLIPPGTQSPQNGAPQSAESLHFLATRSTAPGSKL